MILPDKHGFRGFPCLSPNRDDFSRPSWNLPLAAPAANSLSCVVLDPETQPCYAADMPDTDSRPLAASLNNLYMLSCLHVTPLLEGAVAHRFTECCDDGFGVGSCVALDPAETLLLSEFDRGLVEGSAFNALIAAPWLVKMHGFLTAELAASPVTRPTCSAP
jgi:hypothetical protein